MRYQDQDYVEIYDVYDNNNDVPVPDIIKNAEVIDKRDRSAIVKIDYPIVDGMWSLQSNLGSASMYEEWGKKAYIHGGKYVHPEKGFTVEIREMSPYEYLEECVEMFRVINDADISVDQLIQSRRLDYDLEQVFGGPVFMFYPLIDYRGGQEGIHRAIYAMDNDIGTMPVIVVYESK